MNPWTVFVIALGALLVSCGAAEDVDVPRRPPITQGPVVERFDLDDFDTAIRLDYNDGQHRWEQAGMTLEVLALAIIRRDDLPELYPWVLDEETRSLVMLQVRASNDMDRTVFWYPNQGRLQIGSKRQGGDPASETGGEMSAGSTQEGVVVWQFEIEAEELVAAGRARYVVDSPNDPDDPGWEIERAVLGLAW